MGSQTLTLIRGYSGSGKTTAARKLVEDTGCQHFEADMYFSLGGEYKFDPKLLKKAHQWCQDCTRVSLSMGKDVVVANTFTRLWEMQPYLDMGFPNIVVWRCSGNYQNIHDVPDHVVEQQKQRFEDYEGEVWV